MKTILLIILCGVIGATVAEAKTNVTKQTFGKMPDGTSVDIFTLTDGKVEARIMSFGAIIVSLKTPDRNGKLDDIVLGYDTLDQYVANSHNFYGAVIGRYANRIAHGAFTLDGKQYSLPKNNGENTLHGGPNGFYNVLWTPAQISNGVEFAYLSKDGEEGFPGNLTAKVKYTLENGALRVEYSATADKPTVVNLTQHSYFNLSGEGKGDILGEMLTLHASKFTPIDAGLIPTGEIKSIDGTPFDFRKATRIGERIEANDEQLKRGGGYDHNWVVDGKAGEMRQAAELYDPTSGRVMTVSTDEPGIQFYSGNFLNGAKGKGGVPYPQRSALCLETQHFPDSPNHPDFPSTILRPGQIYDTVTVFKFSTK
jgi:aldose 1-epimerase